MSCRKIHRTFAESLECVDCMEGVMKSRGLTDESDFHKVVQDMDPQKRKSLKDELSKWPDPPGEEEFKGPYNGPDGEELRK